MCIDVFAVGRVATLQFVHEQIWFDVGHRSIKATEVCDLFIENGSIEDIELIRVQFPHFVDLDDLTILSGTEDVAASEYSWFGTFTYNAFQTDVTLALRLNDPALGSAGEKHTGQVLSGSVDPANTFFPPASGNAGSYLEGMRKLDRMVLDIHLENPIPAGGIGWLRIKVEPKTWPGPRALVDLPTLDFLRSPHRFLARLAILSPSHLREELRDSLRNAPYNAWAGDLIDRGWEAPGTLTRIADHRITLVFPNEVQISNIASVPHHTLIPVAPYSIPGSAADVEYCALHFVTGSNINKNQDVVLMAIRICEYLDYLATLGGSASKEHLVNRFGGSEHEAVGYLIEGMIQTQVIVESESQQREPADTGHICYTGAANKERPGRINALFNRYVFPSPSQADELARLSTCLRVLHPFCVSFTLSWTAFDEIQLRRVRWISAIIDQFENLGQLEPMPRHAVVIGCAEYDYNEQRPQVDLVLTSLCRGLQSRGQFQVHPLANPTSADQMFNLIEEVACRVSNGGILLLWFVGHGAPSYNRQDLHLLHKKSRNDKGLAWRSVVEVFEAHKSIMTFAIVDCCHSGLVRKSALPTNTCVWPTAGENEPASASIGDKVTITGDLEDPGGKVESFSWKVAELLERGDPTAGDILTFEQVCEMAQDFCSYNKGGGFCGSARSMGNLPFAINAARGEFAEMVQKIVTSYQTDA